MSRLRLSSSARPILLSLAFVLTYLLLTRPEALVIYQLGSVAWYPVIGVVFGLLLGVSPWYAPVVAVAVAIAGRLTYHEPLHNFGETIGAATLAGAYAGAAFLLRGPLRIDLRLRHRQDVVRYLYISFNAAAVNAMVGAACLAADHSIPWHDYWPAALGWFFGDSIALVAIAPFLLIYVFPKVRQWTFGEDQVRQNPDTAAFPVSSLETLAQAITIVLVVALMFGIQWGRYHTFFLSFVPVIWVAVRQGMRRVAVTLVVLNFAMVLAMDLALPPAELITKISLLMLVVSSVGLIVGAEVSERFRIAINLHEQTSYLNALIEASPLGIVVFNQQGRVEFANPAFEHLILCKRQDLVIGDIATLWLEGMSEALPQALGGEPCHKTVRQKRKDGKTLDLALHAVPLAVKGRVRGVYAIYEDVSEQVRAAEAERKYAESQRELVAQLQARTRQMSLLNEMGSLLQRSGTVDEASTVASKYVQKLFPEASCGVLYRFKSTPKILETAAGFGASGHFERSFRPDACSALQKGRNCWGDCGDYPVGCPHLKQDVPRISLCVPIASAEANLGLLYLEFTEGRRERIGHDDTEWQESQSSLAATVAGEIAISLCSIQLREDLREQAIRDPLTRLYNRRFLQESLGTELQRAKRGHYAVSLLFLDLDHFKRFNDTFGHEAGDTVLRSLAVLLRTFFRASDTCCRAGGEEFAVILPQAAPESATVRANALRLEVKSLQLEHENKPLGAVTVSIGVAAFPDHATTPEALLRIADQCLYDSKARGRDMVTAPKAAAFQGKAGR